MTWTLDSMHGDAVRELNKTASEAHLWIKRARDDGLARLEKILNSTEPAGQTAELNDEEAEAADESGGDASLLV